MIGGIVTSMRKIYTRKNDPMAFVAIETVSGDIEVIVFPKTFAKYEQDIATDNVVLVEGKINAKGRDGNATDELKIIADKVKVLNADTARMWLAPPKEAPKTKSSSLLIVLESIANTDQLMQIKAILDSNSGDSMVTLDFIKTAQKLKLPKGVTISDQLIKKLKSIAGDHNILVATSVKQ